MVEVSVVALMEAAAPRVSLTAARAVGVTVAGVKVSAPTGVLTDATRGLGFDFFAGAALVGKSETAFSAFTPEVEADPALFRWGGFAVDPD